MTNEDVLTVMIPYKDVIYDVNGHRFKLRYDVCTNVISAVERLIMFEMELASFSYFRDRSFDFNRNVMFNKIH